MKEQVIDDVRAARKIPTDPEGDPVDARSLKHGAGFFGGRRSVAGDGRGVMAREVAGLTTLP